MSESGESPEVGIKRAGDAFSDDDRFALMQAERLVAAPIAVAGYDDPRREVLVMALVAIARAARS